MVSMTTAFNRIVTSCPFPIIVASFSFFRRVGGFVLRFFAGVVASFPVRPSSINRVTRIIPIGSVSKLSRMECDFDASIDAVVRLLGSIALMRGGLIFAPGRGFDSRGFHGIERYGGRSGLVRLYLKYDPPKCLASCIKKRESVLVPWGQCRLTKPVGRAPPGSGPLAFDPNPRRRI